MKREANHFPVKDLLGLFPTIEFPQYQREPNIWSRQQKQRLIDSILREFDIASVYFYEREDGVYECIDGRQRLNAIMSFIGNNEEDLEDNGFPLRIESEISTVETEFSPLDGKTYGELVDLSETLDLARDAINALLNYEVSFTRLSDSQSAVQFNLQFLRLNLGTMVNAGEKLHAMVGNMRDLVFKSKKLGEHPFFANVAIPTRRYAQEQVAAQAALQAFSYFASREFTRGRYLDLQKFLKDNASISVNDLRINLLTEMLGELNAQFKAKQYVLGNRAIVVSVVLLAWSKKIENPNADLGSIVDFTIAFLGQLEQQIQNLKDYSPDHNYEYLVEFQRHVTQASVEKRAITKRHEILLEGLDFWMGTRRLLVSGGP